MLRSANFRTVFSESQNANPSDGKPETDFNAKHPLSSLSMNLILQKLISVYQRVTDRQTDMPTVASTTLCKTGYVAALTSAVTKPRLSIYEMIRNINVFH